MVRCPSGLRSTLGKRVGLKESPGFKSLSHRNYYQYKKSPGWCGACKNGSELSCMSIGQRIFWCEVSVYLFKSKLVDNNAFVMSFQTRAPE